MSNHTATPNQTELEAAPCPFCGSNDVHAHRAMVMTEYMAQCNGCDATGPWGIDANAAIAAWNRRAAPLLAEPGDSVADGGA